MKSFSFAALLGGSETEIQFTAASARVIKLELTLVDNSILQLSTLLVTSHPLPSASNSAFRQTFR